MDSQLPNHAIADSRRPRLIALGVVSLVLTIAFMVFKNDLSWKWLIEHETQLQTFADENLLLSTAFCLMLYGFVTGLSIPVATLMTLAFAWLLGFWPALFVVSFGATSGATLAFLLSRYLFREAARSRLGDRFQKMLQNAETDLGLYLFMLRLTPAVPFFVVNLLMSLTHIKARDFWWISQLGMLPLSIAYVYAGSELPNLKTIEEVGIQSILSWRLLLAVCLLGVLPLTFKKLVSRKFFRSRSR